MNTFKNQAVQYMKITGLFLGATILLLWGWNSAVPELFSLPEMQFKQALGLMVLIGIFSGFVGKRRAGNTRPGSVTLAKAAD
jgi:hypothetical protein